MNVVMAGDRFVEVQGTAEGQPFTRAALDDLLDLAEGGIADHRRAAGRRGGRPAGRPTGPRPQAVTVESAADPARPRFVLATANPHKAAEIAAILGPAAELVPRPA